MKVILFGATGMIGQGVLGECIADTSVEKILSIGRTPIGKNHPKLTELLRQDLSHFQGLDAQLKEYDACFYCLGTPSSGKTEEEYSRVSYGFTLAAAQALVKLNPNMTFIYVSGEGADSSEKGPVMWARVRGKTENALLKLPFKGIYIFRPGFIQPLNGIHSRTRLYRLFYKLLSPLLPTLRQMFPNQVSTTTVIGRAMIRIALNGYTKPILRTPDFNVAAR